MRMGPARICVACASKTPGSGDLEAALRQVRRARLHVRVQTERWQALESAQTEPTGRQAGPKHSQRCIHGTAQLRRRRTRGESMRTAATRTVLADLRREPGALALALSTQVLRDLIHDPGQLAIIAGGLDGQHFSRHGHAALFRLLEDMRAARIPIDPVTVGWEAARRGLDTDPRQLGGGVGLFAAAGAAELRRQAILRRISEAGIAIRAAAAASGSCPTSWTSATHSNHRRQGNTLVRGRPPSSPC